MFYVCLSAKRLGDIAENKRAAKPGNNIFGAENKTFSEKNKRNVRAAYFAKVISLNVKVETERIYKQICLMASACGQERCVVAITMLGSAFRL